MSDYVYKKQNTKNGTHALINNKSNNNSAFGFKSLNKNTKGSQNSALGSNSLLNNKTGLNNTAVGFESLKDADSKSNTALGALTGLKLKSGNRNILIGRGANVSKENAMNQIVIGSNSSGHGNNKMVLGNNDLTTIEPAVNGKINLGSKEYKYEDIYIGGNIYKDKQKIGLNFLNDCTLVGPDNSGNLFIGENVGAKSLYDGVNTSPGGSNVVIGPGAFQKNTTGNNNVGLGEGVLKNNTTGNTNVAIGDSVLEANTTGKFNTAVGYGSLIRNSYGNGNTASGYLSLFSNISGGYNTASGNQSLYSNMTGNFNTTVGYKSLVYSTGSYNTAVGYQAGFTIRAGSNNTVIGDNADVSVATDNNSIVIGKGVTGKGSNIAVIGNDDVTDVYMGSDSGATVRCAGIKNITTAGLDIRTNGGTAEKITIQNVQGTASDSIKLDSTAGGITLTTAAAFPVVIQGNQLAHKAQVVTAQVALSNSTTIPTTRGADGVINADTTHAIISNDVANKQVYLPEPQVVGVGHTLTIINYTANNSEVIAAQSGDTATTLNSVVTTTTDNKTLTGGDNKEVLIDSTSVFIASVISANTWSVFKVGTSASPVTPN